MTRRFIPSQLTQFRRDAKRATRRHDLTYAQALDQIAVRHGFANWSLLVKHASGTAAKPGRPAARTAAPRNDAARAAAAVSSPPRMKATRDEFMLFVAIAERFEKLTAGKLPVNRLSLLMDLEACHCNGCPLDLVSLLEAARDFDFVHDISGIMRHLDRETGQLRDGFRPRYAFHHTGLRT